MTPTNWQYFRLGNGLRVVLENGSTTGINSFTIRYSVGSRDEALHQRGWAHALEHLLFRQAGAKSHEEYHGRVRQVGGSANAATWLDFTKFYGTVPAESLELILQLEAARMRELVIDQEVINTELKVIELEGHWAAIQHPLGCWEDELQALAFPDAHGYHHPTIGYPETLSGLNPASAQAFHAQHYNPANSIIAISGGGNTDRTAELIEKHFGAIMAGTPPTRLRLAPALGCVSARRPSRSGTSYIFLAYPAPALGTTAHRHLDLIGDILATGYNCRLALAATEGVTFAEYGFILQPWLATSLVICWVALSPDQVLDPAREFLINLLEAGPDITPEETKRACQLERVRNRQLLESSSERADLAALTVELDQPLEAAFGEESAVTYIDLNTVASSIFRPAVRIALEYYV